MVLEVGTDTWKVYNDGNARLSKKGARANSTALQDLRRVQPSGTKDNLLSCLDIGDCSTAGSPSSLNCDAICTLACGEENFVDAISCEKIQIRAARSRVVICVSSI